MSIRKNIRYWSDIRHWHGLLPLVLFLLLALPSGLYLIFNVPAMWSADGGAHTARVFQIAEGGFRPQYINHNHGVGYGGNIPTNLNDLKNLELNLVGQSPVAPGQETTQKLLTAQDKKLIAAQSNQPIAKQRVLISFVNTAAYSPVAYGPNVIGVVIGEVLHFSLGHTILLARLCSFFALILCVGYSLFTIRNSQLKWLVMTVSLLPLVVFQSTVITADSFLYAVSILFSALLIKGLSPRLRLTFLDKLILFLCVLLLPLLKSVYFLLVFAVLFIPKRHWSSDRTFWLWAASSLALSMIGFGIWSALTTDVAASNGLVRGDTTWIYGDATLQRNFVLHHPLGYLHVLWDTILYGSKFYMDTFFGWLGFTYLPIPGVAEVAGFLAIGLSALLPGRLSLSKRARWAILGIVIATVLLVFTTLYVYYSPVMNTVVQGVQGRYFLPLTIVGVSMITALLPKLRVQADGATTAKVVLVCLISFCFAYSMLRYGIAITT